MPDPVTAATAASAPAAIGTGLSALALALIGVDVQALALGLAGSTLGLTFAPPVSILHFWARFIAASIASASVGTAIGQYTGSTGAVICGCGVVMHLFLAWLGGKQSGKFGGIADAGLRRVGIEPAGDDK